MRTTNEDIIRKVAEVENRMDEFKSDMKEQMALVNSELKQVITKLEAIDKANAIHKERLDDYKERLDGMGSKLWGLGIGIVLTGISAVASLILRK